ncbi:DUF6069 family protein [Micromonospora sp. NRRL B-16802]|uniref:DUF6069 family protein n=1 Tax=Micromonospora sp. NRRL B-16802 TaxID=1415541 RepID=UPI003515D234
MNRGHRIWGVVGAVGMAAALWMVAVPLLGHRLTVTGGPPGRERLEIGLTPVVIAALAAALAGWALLALLERVLPRSARLVWTITALGVPAGALCAPNGLRYGRRDPGHPRCSARGGSDRADCDHDPHRRSHRPQYGHRRVGHGRDQR